MSVAVSQCSSCGAEILTDDSYCQDCGKYLGTQRQQLHESKQHQLSSVVQRPDHGYLAHLNPGSAKPVVALPVVATAVALFILIPLGIFALERSSSSISAQYIFEQARGESQQHHSAKVIELLSRLKLAHGALNKDEGELLNHALLEQAQELFAARSYAAALANLNIISPDFSQAKEVTQLSSQCIANLPQPHLSPSPPSKHSPARHHQATGLNQGKTAAKGRSLSVAQRSETKPAQEIQSDSSDNKAVASLSHSRQQQDEKLRSQQGDSIAETQAKPAADVAQVVPPQTPAKTQPVATRTNKSAAAGTDGADNAATKETAIGRIEKAPAHNKFTNNDLARYNELLAGYFSRAGAVQSNPGQHEPPPFREWLNMGKPKF